jgi:hypothetical protein
MMIQMFDNEAYGDGLPDVDCETPVAVARSWTVPARRGTGAITGWSRRKRLEPPRPLIYGAAP